MALSAALSHPATKWSRKLTALTAGAAAAVALFAGLSALLDLRQETIDQKAFVHRSEKFNFTVVDTIAAQGILLAPATVNAWSSTVHIGWTPLEVGPAWCKEQSYMIKKPGPSVFTHMPNDWYLCGRAASARHVLPLSMTSGYWLYPLQVFWIGVILAWLGWKLWPRRTAPKKNRLRPGGAEPAGILRTARSSRAGSKR
jgi:hypothetical protein